MVLGSHAAAGGALSPEVSPTWGLSAGAGSERGPPHTFHTATGTLFVSRLPRAARCQFLSGRGKQGQGADLTSTPAREQRCVSHTHPSPQCQSVLLPVGSDGHAFLIPTGSHGGMRGTWRVPLAPGPRGWQGVGRAPLTPAASSGDSSVTSVLSQILSDVSMATFTRISWNIRCLSWKGPRRSAPSTPSAHREESGLRECAYLGGGQRVPHAQQGPCLRAPLPARVPLPEIADR